VRPSLIAFWLLAPPKRLAGTVVVDLWYLRGGTLRTSRERFAGAAHFTAPAASTTARSAAFTPSELPKRTKSAGSTIATANDDHPPGNAHHFAHHLGVTAWTPRYASVTKTSGKVALSPFE
jgi:hypothetical protein